MAVGQQNNLKVLIIIQARMKSTRLPGKVLMPIPMGASGKPVIKWIVDGLKLSQYLTDVIVATSRNKENDDLVSYCNSNAIRCFRGDEDNVLSRFIEIVKKDSCDAVVRLTGDNPIIDSDYLKRVLEFHFHNKNDYSKTIKMPLGMNFEIMSPRALLTLESERLTDYDREHVTPFIIKNDKFKKMIFETGSDPELNKLRLTLDYPSDYLVISALLTLSEKLSLSGMKLVEKTYADYPWIFDVNQENIQKIEYPSLEDELLVALEILGNCDLKRAAHIIKTHITTDR